MDAYPAEKRAICHILRKNKRAASLASGRNEQGVPVRGPAAEMICQGAAHGGSRYPYRRKRQKLVLDLGRRQHARNVLALCNRIEFG